MEEYKLFNGERRDFESASDIQIGVAKDVVTDKVVGYWAGAEFPGEHISSSEYERLKRMGVQSGNDIPTFYSKNAVKPVGFEDAYEIQITVRGNGKKMYTAYYNDGDYEIDEDVANALEKIGARVENLPEEFT